LNRLQEPLVTAAKNFSKKFIEIHSYYLNLMAKQTLLFFGLPVDFS